ncbi:SLC13 family permease [Calidifontibacillus oryziterrae]|uniref:SLC13 family permease n=1 Tax=Calidifontibacillus oryziterrae TaxID=1191699 RepID=UPI000312BA67|nr:SLC13 family permease [Calidifontibacillus oryziterrae]
MSFEMIFVLVMIILMMAGLAFEVARPDMIVFGTVTIFLLFGILTPEEALRGFSNEGMLTVALLFIIAGVIQKSGVVESAIRKILGSGKSEKMSLFKILVPVSGLSGFLNNTPIVVAFTPLLRKWCVDNGLSPSKFLIPLSYVTVLGGTITLIGTSTNLVVHGLMLDYGMKGFSMFELAVVGIPITIIGILYLLTIGHKVLPNHKVSPTEKLKEQTRDYMCEFVVGSDYPFINKSVGEAGLRHLEGLFLVAIIRDDMKFSPVKSTTKIEAGDRLIFAGLLSTIAELQQRKGLAIETGTDLTLETLKNGNSQLVEVVVSDQSPLVYKKIRDTQFRGRYDAAIIAVHRNHERVKSKIGEIVLKPGDTLLLLTGSDFLERDHYNDFYVVTPLETPKTVEDNTKGALIALITMLVMIIFVTFNVLSMFKAMALATIILLLLRIVSPEEAKQSIQFNVLLLIASSFGIGAALLNTGTAAWIANGLVSFTEPLGLFFVLLIIYLITNIFTEIMSNTATAVMMFPIGVEMANQLSINPMSVIVLVTIAASAAFATPIGYQTNLIVYGPGGYHFKDYMKVGIPLNLLCMVVAVSIVYMVWL